MGGNVTEDRTSDSRAEGGPLNGAVKDSVPVASREDYFARPTSGPPLSQTTPLARQAATPRRVAILTETTHDESGESRQADAGVHVTDGVKVEARDDAWTGMYGRVGRRSGALAGAALRVCAVAR